MNPDDVRMLHSASRVRQTASGWETADESGTWTPVTDPADVALLHRIWGLPMAPSVIHRLPGGGARGLRR